MEREKKREKEGEKKEGQKKARRKRRRRDGWVGIDLLTSSSKILTPCRYFV